MRVLVLGATGYVSGSLVSQLLHLPKPPFIRVSTRNPSAAFPPTVEFVKGDLTDPSTYPALFSSIDRVFLYAVKRCPLLTLCQAMHTAGVQRVVQLSSKVVVSEPDAFFARPLPRAGGRH